MVIPISFFLWMDSAPLKCNMPGACCWPQVSTAATPQFIFPAGREMYIESVTRTHDQVAVWGYIIILYSIRSRRNSGFCGIFSCLCGEENGFRWVSSCCSKTVGETCRNLQKLVIGSIFCLLRTSSGSIMISDLRTDAELSGIEKSSTMEEKT